MGVRWERDPLQQPLPRVVVPRPGLQRTLDRIEPGGLGLLVASAGSGKSVLARQWLGQCRPELRTAALSLTPAHDDAVVFARELLEAVRAPAPQVDPSIGDLVEMGRSALGERFVDAVLGELATLPQETVLVLEDLHLLTNAALVADVGRIVTRLPRTTRCIVTTRRDPPWSLRQMRLDGRLVEVRGADLAFVRHEARQLLEAVSDRELTDREVAVLLDRTDGWAVGLQLAAVSLRDVPDIGAAVDSIAGSDRLVGEYLLQEVLAQQDPETRAFLLRTSVLDRMSVDLCNAVTGSDDARAILDDLDKRSLLVTSLDRSGDQFRYHHLFADLLRYQLRLEDPSAASEAHHRAARWLLDHGFPEDAVEHLLCAGEHQQAFAVVTAVAHLLFERGESATLVRWLTTIDGALLDAPPAVGVNLLAAQVAADRSDAAAETHRRLLKRPDLTPGQRASADALHTTLVFRGLPPEVVLTTAASVLELLPSLDAGDVVDFLGIGGLESVRVMAEYDAAIARFLLGDLAEAASALEHVLTLPGLAYPIWKIYTLGSLALVRAWTGHCTEALQLADAAIRTGRAIGVVGHASQIHAHLAIALVHLDRADLDGAARSLAKADRQNQRRPSSVVNRDLQRTLVARLTAVTEGPGRALAILRQPAESAVPPPVLVRADRTLEAQLLIGTGDTLGARTMLKRLGRAPELAPAQVDVALANHDLAAAREALDHWQPPPHDLRASIGHELRHAVALDLAGDQSTAQVVVREAAATAEGERLCWPFLEVPAALRMLRSEPVPRSRFPGAAVLRLARLLEPRERAQERLVAPLSERELTVLAYLPKRIKNQDIADELYVTVNTLKTHLRAIYRKLGVDNRDQAIDRATELGLL